MFTLTLAILRIWNLPMNSERWWFATKPEPGIVLDGVEMAPGWREPFGLCDLEWCEEDAVYFERIAHEMRRGPWPDENTARAMEKAALVCDEAASKRRRWAEVIRRRVNVHAR